MAKVSTLRARVREIRRKFKRVNGFRFFYNTKRDLSKHYHRIKVWFLIHDAVKGYSIFSIDFKRVVAMSVREWHSLFTHPIENESVAPTPNQYDPLFSIFTLKILPAINVRNGSQWKFKTLIGWAGMNDIRPGKHSDSRSPRNKTAKERNANARYSSRRGQRNRTR